jgi:hypothetical protein
MADFAGAGWGDVPSSDPRERGDDGGGNRPDQAVVPKNTSPDDGKTYDNTAGSTSPGR